MQGDSVVCLSLLPRSFPHSQYEIDTWRFVAEGHDRLALSHCHLLIRRWQMQKTLLYNDVPRSRYKVLSKALLARDTPV